MGYISEGFFNAITLLASGDAETYSAVFTTLKASTLSIAVSLLLGILWVFCLVILILPGRNT